MRRSARAATRPRRMGKSTQTGRLASARTSSWSVRFDMQFSLLARVLRPLARAVDGDGQTEEEAVVGNVVEGGGARALPDARAAAMEAPPVAEAPGCLDRAGGEVDQAAVGGGGAGVDALELLEVAAARPAGAHPHGDLPADRRDADHGVVEHHRAADPHSRGDAVAQARVLPPLISQIEHPLKAGAPLRAGVFSPLRRDGKTAELQARVVAPGGGP